MRVQVLCTPALLDGSSPRIASLDKKLMRTRAPRRYSAGAFLKSLERERPENAWRL